MNLLQKVALVVVAAALTMSGLALIQGEIYDAAVGVFVSACALLTNFRMWPPKPLWGRRKN
jgi:hypothetical protein